MRLRRRENITGEKVPREKIEGPAKIHAGHSRRALGAAAGAGKGWRNDAEHPLSLALAKGQLIRGKDCHSPRMRFDAGDRYRVVYEAACPRGRDELRVPTGGIGQPINDRMIDAGRWLKAVEAQLNVEDRAIVRLVCGEGFWPSEAVRAASGHSHYDKAVVPRFNEALDHLIEAIRNAPPSPV
jgi:hypothetical protein